MSVSIHLMLLFINVLRLWYIPSTAVSIHLMLLFIFFSTSLANVLAVSIHLMLLFIWDSNVVRVRVRGFQYISCYSLSVNILILFLLSLCFNTSHVTLYLIALQLVLDVWSFQYISCYSLSMERLPEMETKIVFQYISCYSLSSTCQPHKKGE